jgi:hypothetical protein
MRKIAMIGAAAMMAMALAGCKSTCDKCSGSMGATSGQCEKGDACCKNKASMGATSGQCEKGDACCKNKASMGTVSGECSKAKSCSSTCTKSAN